MPSATWMWKPVMPSLAATIFSKVRSERVNRAWPPNMARIMSSSCSLHHLAKSAFSRMASLHFSMPSRSLTS